MPIPASSSELRNAREPFADLVAMSHRMLAEAEAGHWDEVMRLQVERQGRLEAFFATPVPQALAEQVAVGIRQMLDSDRRLMELGRKGMDTLAGAMDDLRAGRRAQRAYGAAGA